MASTTKGGLRDPEAAAYRRNAARLTTAGILAPGEKDRLIQAEPAWRRRRRRDELAVEWGRVESDAATEANTVLGEVRGSVDELTTALEALDLAQVPELRGVVRNQLSRVRAATE